MNFNQDIDKHISQYFDGSINNVDKDLIDILVMTDASVASKFYHYKDQHLNPNKTSTAFFSWKVPLTVSAIGVLALFIFWPKGSEIRDVQPISNPTTTLNNNIELVVESIESKNNIEPVISTSKEPQVLENIELSQKSNSLVPELIFSPKAVGESIEEIEYNANSKNIQTLEVNKKTTKKVPLLRKGKRTTVVPIEDSGF